MTATERTYTRLLLEQQTHARHAMQALERGDHELAQLLGDLAGACGREADRIERQIADEREAITICKDTRAAQGVRQFLANFKRAIPTAMTVGQWR
jgi:hypothetical protein